jgi:nicotinate-nucleotide adenylyltransferase
MSAINPLTEPVAIFGGTFDPLHLGHLRVAEEVADSLALREVRLIPSGTPPHRPPPFFSSAQRLQFCELAAQNNPRLRVDAREVYKTGPSYTIETLETLRKELKTAPQVLILGADAFLGLHKWHRWTEILDFAHIALVERPGFDIAAQLPNALKSLYAARLISHDAPGAVRAALAGNIFPVTVTALDISATRIRALLSERKSVKYLVTAAQEEYLRLSFDKTE